jgi:hypothetical protein
MRAGLLAAIVVVTVAFAIPAHGQAPPQPGPEHEILKMEAGTWDAAIDMAAPDGTTAQSKGVQVDTLGCGGLCLISEFKGELMPGMMFEGHGVTTFDRTKKKYVGSWTDSMSTGLSVSEGTYDAATKTMTSWMEGPDMTGTVVKMKSVGTYPDADHKTMTMFMPRPDGKDVQGMKISYTRRK